MSDEPVTMFRCPPEAGTGTCEPFDDPRSHDWSGEPVEFQFGEGTVCTSSCARCGITSFSHSMRFGP